MATIIDALVVTLGINTDPYKAGRVRAEQEQSKLKDSAKKSGNEVSSALKEVGTQVATLFLGFEGLKGALNFFTGLNVANANLGRFSANLGESAHEVNTWSSAVELAGGTAADAQSDLQALSSSITALKATGEVSQLLLTFQRMGVAIYDAQGKTRKLTDIYKDFGDRLRTYNRADAFNLAKQAGVSASTFNLIAAQADERQRLLSLAEQNNTVTDESIKQAEELQERWRGIKQTLTGVANTLLGEITPAIKEVFSWVQQVFTGVKNTGFLQGVFSALGGAIRVVVDLVRIAWSGITQLFNLFADSRVGKWLVTFAKGFGTSFVEQADALANKYAPAAAAATKTASPTSTSSGIPRNNPGNLRYAGQTGATNEGGFASFPTLAAGIQAANRQLDLYAARGVNTIDAIVRKWAPSSENDTEGYIGRIVKATGKGAKEQLSAADRQRLLQAIFTNGEGNRVSLDTVGSSLLNPNALSAARFASSQSVPGSGAAAAGGVTKVDIDTINVTTQATDARGVAEALPGALKRKGVVAQADSGMS
jgi:hypothetical protein